ncbi:NADH-quinone oxidoreductase subunit G [Allostreptomyces psammosilenae]|uniref:NADH-quinone oxidoreductase n=1 Tax=Allostreptomyces psammosilenae TaxID=1892865 RepID=A0A852ZV83_9ACTN|nr:NADH-quinone oxidoreductase subunit G [Allostreptomyces psammosilenae]NYI05835.1 NADH-quinone oxidoreductase subunit G [Allostreptomyces psammosilenae]
MTVTTNAPAGPRPPAPPEETVTCTIDGVSVTVPKGTLVIRAAELLGITVPRFCDHPLLDPVGACRQCIVEIEGQRKPVASCTIPVADGMVIRTQLTSPVAEKAQRGVMELLLINHPLDCPVCDKGGECPLQNQAMSSGSPETRFDGVKRTFPKPVPVSTQVLLDRERCVLCARCTRFSEQIAGDPFIQLTDRGADQQVGIAEGEPFRSYFSGNTIQICPVGALTSAAYRFRARPFDLVSSPTVCEHCAGGCALRTDHRRGKVLRRQAGDDPEVNEEWNCDKGRFAFRYAQLHDRLTTPLVRGQDGELRPASWPEALRRAADALTAARGRAAALPGGRVTVEDAYAWAKFTRLVLGSNDVDFRARVHSAEEADFLAAHVAGRAMEVVYADLERAPMVLLAGLEPEEESAAVFLRLRKGVRKNRVAVASLAPFASRGLRKLDGTLLRAAPGTETDWLRALAEDIDGPGEEAAERAADLGETGRAVHRALRTPGALLLVGERLAGVPGALTAAADLAAATGARLAWVPRRAGERGAVEAGALPGLLPGGRPATDPAARAETAAVWRIAELPGGFGRDTAAIIDAAASGELDALVVGGVDPNDLPAPRRALAALERVPFLVSLEQRPSEVTALADVVLPVAAVAEKDGAFATWEGRLRPFRRALREDQHDRERLLPDLRVLDMLADAADVHLGLPDVYAARRELDELGTWQGERPTATLAAALPEPTATVPAPVAGEAVLAGWRQLLDESRLQEGEPHLAGTRHEALARLSAATAASVGVEAGAPLRVSGPDGHVELPLEITDMPDGVVWLPLGSVTSGVPRRTGALPGQLVRIEPGTRIARPAGGCGTGGGCACAPGRAAQPPAAGSDGEPSPLTEKGER